MVDTDRKITLSNGVKINLCPDSEKRPTDLLTDFSLVIVNLGKATRKCSTQFCIS